MKVSDLIEMLEEMDPEAEVVAPSGPHNLQPEEFYEPVEDVSPAYVYSPETAKVYLKELTPALKALGYNKHLVWNRTEVPDAIPCVVVE